MNVLDHIYAEFVDYAPRPQSDACAYNTLLTSYSNVIDQLMTDLSPEQKQLFLELESQRNLIAAADEENMFTFGFTIGIKLILEVLYLLKKSL